jgi:hypothetical protein
MVFSEHARVSCASVLRSHIEEFCIFREHYGKESYPVSLVPVKQHLPVTVAKNSVLQYGSVKMMLAEMLLKRQKLERRPS